MNINLYLKAHVFNSSNAAVELAQKNIKHQHFAEAMILKKLDKVMNSSNTYHVSKASKYNDLLTKLSENTAASETFRYYDVSPQSKQNTVNQTGVDSPEKKETKECLSKIADEIKSHRKEPAEIKKEKLEELKAQRQMEIDRHIAFISTPQYSAHILKCLSNNCENVLDLKHPNRVEVRKITTNLEALSMVRGNDALATQAKEFLKQSIDGTNFQSFGNKDGYSAETLQKVKDCVVEIKDWVNQIQAKYQ
jgi:hypothetical protein